MNQKSDTHIKLASYLFNDLEPEEIKEMDRQMADDQELAESYRLQVQVRDYLKARIQLEEIRSDPMLEEAESLAEHAFRKEKEPGAGRQREWSGYIPAAAAVVLVLLVIRIWVPVWNPDRLYHRYYEPLSAADYTQRNEAGIPDTYLSGGIQSYNKGQYERSLFLLQQVGNDPAYIPDVMLFRALDHMGLEQYPAARDLLEDYLKNPTRYLPEATWYLSLCYLKTGEYEKARENLIQLEEYEGFYQDQAVDLVKKLRRIRK
jgi:hypothetical protein